MDIQDVSKKLQYLSVQDSSKFVPTLINTKLTIAFDFDKTLTSLHSVIKDDPVGGAVRDMSRYIDQTKLSILLTSLQTSGLNWIISFANIETIRCSLESSKIADFFRTKTESVPDTIRSHQLYSKMTTESGYFWRILTPSVLLNKPDSARPKDWNDLYKVTFMNMALSITNLFRDAQEKEQISPKDLLLIDDTEDNVNQCSRNGFMGLAISQDKQLCGSLCFDQAKEKETGGYEWLSVLFQNATLIKKEAELWSTNQVEVWSYYKI